MVYKTNIMDDHWVTVVNIPSKNVIVNVSLEVMIVYVPRDDVIVHDFDYDVDRVWLH